MAYLEAFSFLGALQINMVIFSLLALHTFIFFPFPDAYKMSCKAKICSVISFILGFGMIITGNLICYQRILFILVIVVQEYISSQRSKI